MPIALTPDLLQIKADIEKAAKAHGGISLEIIAHVCYEEAAVYVNEHDGPNSPEWSRLHEKRYDYTTAAIIEFAKSLEETHANNQRY